MAFDYYKAKEAGYSDEEIAQYLAQDNGLNYQAAVQAGYQPIEIIGNVVYGINVDTPMTGGEGFARGVERGVTGTTRGVGQVMEKVSGLERTAPPEDIVYDAMGNVVSGGTAPSVQEQRTGKSVKFEDQRKELEYEIAKAQGNKFATMGGYVVGTLADPANIITGLGAPTVKTLAVEGALTGGVQGFFDPIYGEPDTYGNRLINAGMGATGGGVLGAGFGKVLKKFGFIEKETPSVGTIADEVNAPTVSTKGVEDAVNTPISTPKAEPEIVTPKVEAVEPTPVTTVEDIQPSILQGYDQKLPKGLEKAAPRYGRDVVGFESDLDRALYIVRDSANRSKADQAYMNWIKQVTGLQDEALIRSFGDKVKSHVAGIPDKGVIPPSLLELGRVPKTAQIASQQAPIRQVIPTQPSTMDLPTAPYKGVEIDQLGDAVSPTSKAWNTLDNPSKNMYNIGRKFLESDITGAKPRLSPAEQLDAIKVVNSIDPNFKQTEMPDLFRSYSKVVDDLYRVKGIDFQPPSLAKLMREGLDDADMLELMAKGVFDGCTL